MNVRNETVLKRIDKSLVIAYQDDYYVAIQKMGASHGKKRGYTFLITHRGDQTEKLISSFCILNIFKKFLSVIIPGYKVKNKFVKKVYKAICKESIQSNL